MSSYHLKLIAIITMLIDHTGAVFISSWSNPQLYLLFRGIGRLSFPIFVFLIVEGFHHTRNVKKYLLRLGIFAFISELPFDLAFYYSRFGNSVMEDLKAVFVDGFQAKQMSVLLSRFGGYQNIFFTLFLGLLLIYLLSLCDLKFQNNNMLSSLVDVILILAFCGIAMFLKTDYDAAGIILVVVFYLFRGRKLLLSGSLFLICALMMSNITAFLSTGNILSVISLFATFSMIPIAFYNGKKGKDVKYIFYIFYPAHLLILFVISCVIWK
jgi:hypothetical protein